MKRGLEGDFIQIQAHFFRAHQIVIKFFLGIIFRLIYLNVLISIYLSDRIVAFDQPDLTQQRKYEERYRQLLHRIVKDHPFIASILRYWFFLID